MKIKRIYTGEDGHSHIGEIDFDLSEVAFDNTPQKTIATTAAVVKENPPGFVSPWHVQKKRALIIQLEGQVEVEVHGGGKTIFKEGEIVLYEDKTGSGHRVSTVGHGLRRLLVIMLE